MMSKRIFRLLFCTAMLSGNFLFGQADIEIKDLKNQVIATLNFEVYAAQPDKTEYTFLGYPPVVNLKKTHQNTFGVRFKDLIWVDSFENEKTTLEFETDNIKISPDGAAKTAKEGRKFRLSPVTKNKGAKIEIDFVVLDTASTQKINLVFEIWSRNVKVHTHDMQIKILGKELKENTLPTSEQDDPKAKSDEASPDVNAAPTIDPPSSIPEPTVDSASIALMQAWESVPKNEVLALRNFLSKYENNSQAKTVGYIGIAEAQIKKMETRTWEVAQRQKRYQKYISLFPNGKHIAEAKKLAKVKGKKDADELFWEKVEKAKKKEKLAKEYLEKYPEGRFIDDANEILQESLPIEITQIGSGVKENYRYYVLQLKNVISPKVLNLDIPGEISFDRSSLYDDHQLTVLLQTQGDFDILIEDVSWDKSATHRISNIMSASVSSQGDSLIISLEGGIPPYRLDFLKQDAEIADRKDQFFDLQINAENNIILSLAALQEKGLNGIYTQIDVWDDFSEEAVSLTAYNDNSPIQITIKPKQTNSLLAIILPLALLGLGLIAFLLYRNRRRKYMKAYAIKQAELRQVNQMSRAPKAEAPTTNSGPRKSINISKRDPAKSARETTIGRNEPATRKSGGSSNSKIKITTRSTRKAQEWAEFQKIVANSGNYNQVSLSNQWFDTSVSHIFLNHDCIRDLTQFLKEENLDHVVEEKEGLVPEVGGFLMGYFSLDDGKYAVSLDKFIPFVPEYADYIKIEIGTDTLVQELADAQDKFPKLSVIGWFHTHPGHGLFLSVPDLAVQKHFAEKYQIAMEIDSLTDRLDTAFFTQKNNGRMNNAHDREAENWFSWHNIKKNKA